MWTGLRGTFHPFLDVACDPPEPVPTLEGDWQTWAALNLEAVAAHEQWQAGRYHYTVERATAGTRWRSSPTASGTGPPEGHPSRNWPFPAGPVLGE